MHQHISLHMARNTRMGNRYPLKRPDSVPAMNKNNSDVGGNTQMCVLSHLLGILLFGRSCASHQGIQIGREFEGIRARGSVLRTDCSSDGVSRQMSQNKELSGSADL